MQYLDPILIAYFLIVAGVLGLVMGSFINCWAWRFANGESVAHGRSHCTSCGHVLGVRDLVPVFSWLASRGKCRHCGERVSARYPLTELACCAVFVAIVAVYGISLEAAELLAFAGILLFISLVDLDEYIIPNGAIVAAIGVRVAYLLGVWACSAAGVATRIGAVVVPNESFVGQFAATGIDAQVAPDVVAMAIESAIGGAGLLVGLLVLVLIADRVFKRESMGGGDLKLFFVAGLYFGWKQGLFLLVVSCIVGVVMAFAAPAGKLDVHYDDDDEPDVRAASDGQPASKVKRSIPFGPSIAIACIVTMLVGAPFVDWYFSLL